MLSLREKIKQVPWETLHHAYGTAQDTPTLLLDLLTDHDEQFSRALDRLWASICHQGSVYEASCAVVPVLIDMLSIVPAPRKPEILALLEGLAHISWYANKDQRFLRMRRTRQQWHSWGEFLNNGNEYHEPQWMRQAHQLVGEGIETYLALLQSPDSKVVQAALDLLAGFREYNTQLIPVIEPLAFTETRLSIQTAALRCLGALLEQDSPLWRIKQNVTALYGLPITKPELEAFLANQ